MTRVKFDALCPAMIVRLVLVILTLCSATSLLADSGIRLIDIASDPASGLGFTRTPSATLSVVDAMKQQSLIAPIDPASLVLMPYNANGQPGIALFDHDHDGDLDIYVTNGPGTPNSLFSSQLEETGQLTFIDVASPAGVDATAQDGMGVCYGDVDNDGDDDLLVLGRDEANRFFANQGDGTFKHIAESGLEGGDRSSPSCAMGDINGDGLLDVAVANAYDHGDLLACIVEPFALIEHNQLFLNQGNHTFLDVSATSGIENLAGLPPEAAGVAGITWALSMVDVDLDGDLDLVFADDQCALDNDSEGGVDRGFIHVMLNSGSGQFTDSPVLSGEFPSGSWMGLGFGDLNCDGHLDIFGSNFGDYAHPSAGNPRYLLGEEATRPLYGRGDGTFRDPGIGDFGASAFGWGNAIFDYDNDGDLDLLYHGGLDFLAPPTDNPGVLLENEGCGENFHLNLDAFPLDHRRRMTQAVAIGDLDRNGFVDVVTGSTFDFAPGEPLIPSPAAYGSPLDPLASFAAIWEFAGTGFVWTGVETRPGSLTVELSSGDNGNGWVAVQAVGSIGLTEGGRVNRSGIGAVVSVTPRGGKAALRPVEGGSSFASQHSLEVVFGLGSAEGGRIEVLWPGGVRNRLYGVESGWRVTLPEIPCSFDAEWSSKNAYKKCVRRALDDLRRADIISPWMGEKLFRSAVLAFRHEHQ